MKESASALRQLQQKLGLRWPAIARCRAASAARLDQLHHGLAQFTSEDASVVVFGSLARAEHTSGSDIDWTLLVDGQTFPELLAAADDASVWIRERFRGPGREGTFGSLSFSHELVHHIGGAADTNRNLTQRILLLLESLPIGRAEAYTRVVRALLERYISEDFGWSHSPRQSYVPRFLQNDIARYWRTVAVDFAYKRKERAGEGWALRTVKLRLSRKLTYAAGLVACFRCSLLRDLHPGFEQLPIAERARVAVEEMEAFLRSSPLEMLAWAYLHFGIEESAAALFGSYDRFLEMMDSDERNRLAGLSLAEAPSDALFRTARDLGDTFQDALDELFLPRSGGGFYELTRTYGVF
jgi:hypothetical protein